MEVAPAVEQDYARAVLDGYCQYRSYQTAWRRPDWVQFPVVCLFDYKDYK